MEEEIVNHNTYILVKTLDNSAPCSKCAFFRYDSCAHPDKSKRNCKHELGTHKGWNTLEYKIKD